MPTLILENKSEWVVGAPVVAEVERLRAENTQLRTTLDTASKRYDEAVDDRDRMLDERDELRAKLDKAVGCLVCLPIADPVEVCENTLDILLPGWREADTPKEGTYISRMTVDVPSRSRPGHVHKAGTEIAPVERIGKDTGVWLVEVRVPDETLEGGFWWETLELKLKEETEVVLVSEGSSND